MSPLRAFAGATIVGALLCAALAHRDAHPRELLCCTSHDRPEDVLGDAQKLHATGDTPAMCRQRGGNVIWVNDLYEGCAVGNVLGATVQTP